MGYNRRRSNIKKYQINNKGIALITALALAIVILIILAGLYYFMVNFFGISQNIKVYSSTRDAAIGGINYGLTKIYQNDIPTNVGDCKNFTIKYKLSSDSNNYENKITICLLKKEINSSSSGNNNNNSSGPVTYINPGQNNDIYVFSIISEADGPNNTKSRIEAIYKP